MIGLVYYKLLSFYCSLSFYYDEHVFYYSF